MKRRKFLLAAAAFPAISWTRLQAAQAKPPIVIGYLETGSRESGLHFLTAFKEGMAAHGWSEGTQYVVEEGWLENHMERLPKLAQELAAKKPQIVVATPSSLVAAAAKVMPGTPIVQMGGSPLESGNVAGLARPAGMITGLSALSVDLVEKLVELLREAMPKVRRVGFLMDPTAMTISASQEQARRAVKRYSIDARFVEASNPEELEPAISRLAKDGAQAIVVLPNVWFPGERHRIVKTALGHGLSVTAGGPQYAEVGGLIAYGAEVTALRRRAAYFVDRILKGAKPGDLPIEQPTKFELAVNLKTAKTLGIAIPPSILVRATRVVE